MTRVPMPGNDAANGRPVAIVSPSILASDFARLADECKRMVDLGADWLHVDVMDGHFVPNLTLGAPIVESLRKHTSAFLDVHLMVTKPQQWVKDFAKAGADMYTFHIEAVAGERSLSADVADKEVCSLCQEIKDSGMHVGIAVKPGTPADLVCPYVEKGLVDMVLVMTVEPGFGGQKFNPDAAQKCAALRRRFPNLHLQVDGGLAPSTIDVAAAAGANVIVAGSAVFNAAQPGEVIQVLRDSVTKATPAA